MAGPGGAAGALRLPEGVAFVTPDWVSQSIVKQQVQPVEPRFLPAFLKQPPHGGSAAGVAAGGAPPAGTAPAGGTPADSQAASPAACPGQERLQDALEAEQGPTSSTATRRFDEQEQWAAEQDVQQQQAAAPPASAPPSGIAPPSHRRQQRVPCRVVRQGSEFVAVQGVKPQYTGARLLSSAALHASLPCLAPCVPFLSACVGNIPPASQPWNDWHSCNVRLTRVGPWLLCMQAG